MNPHSTTFAPGAKTHKDENFPVASRIIKKAYRSAILRYYDFARASDDVADHPTLSPAEKIKQLDAFEDSLLGNHQEIAVAVALREECLKRNISLQHGQDLLTAFRRDAVKLRYENWQELLDYCRYSASPVGRFVLDVHGEHNTTWPASDALCSALQIINHIQDCKADLERFDRVYIPLDTLAQFGASVADIGAPKASASLRQCLTHLVQKTQEMLLPRALSSQVHSFRLSAEVLCIERLAASLCELLIIRDPLCENVHLPKSTMLRLMLYAILATIVSSRHPVAIPSTHSV